MTPQELKYSILGDAFTGKLCELTEDRDFGEIKTIKLEDNPFDIPDNWAWSTLGLCCEMYTGNSISETVKAAKYADLEEGYDYIATKDVTFNQEICYDNGVRIPYKEGFKVAYKDAILMCIEGGSAGRKIGILDRDVCFGNKLCSFHVREIDNKYLYYYLQSWLFKELFSGNMTGIIGGVSIKKLKDIFIPVAPLNEQKRIVAKIEELLPYIDRYEKAWNKLEEFNKRFPVDMQKSILQMAIQGKLVEQRPEEGTGEELYQQIQAEKQRLIKAGKIKKEKPLPEIAEEEIPFDIPESWRWAKIGEIFTVVRGSSPRPKGSPLYWSPTPTQHHWITIKDITSFAQSGTLCQTHEFLTDEGATKSTFVPTEELIIAVSGSTTGKFCILGIGGYIYDGLAAVLNPTKILGNQYLRYFFMWIYERLNSLKVGSAFPNINTDMLKNTLIPIPPLEEQKRIVAKLEEILPLCEKLK